MIIVDFSAISIANILATKIEIEEGMLRHMILNSLRMYNLKFRKEYGEVVIACDSSSWRKQYFTQYKAKRKVNRDESTLDWNALYEILDKIVNDLRDNFPYRVIKIDGAEGDDIIGAIVEEISTSFGQNENIMIISSDKDFLQLQRHKNVSQFSPMQKKLLKESNPNKYLFEHIVKGDAGDGVPNILSPDNSFTDKIRQTPVTQKILNEYKSIDDIIEKHPNETIRRNAIRNRTVIDLRYIPESIKESIINNYTIQDNQAKNKLKVMNYLIKNRCRNLIEVIEEFYPWQ